THDPSLMTGRLPQNAIVHFKGDASLIGRIIPVTITESRDFYFFGESASS
ncbi:MAG: TRAM domain-containing protein, partial [Lachnospiraceae bacterium]|nr:TRAM domain-containing protein [Lachnospiraceae bacterium]